MCMSGSKAAKKAAKAQAEATEKLAAAQRAKTTDMVSQTQGIIQVNQASKIKKPMYSLRIPLKTNNQLGAVDNTYGLNIPI